MLFTGVVQISPGTPIYVVGDDFFLLFIFVTVRKVSIDHIVLLHLGEYVANGLIYIVSR